MTDERKKEIIALHDNVAEKINEAARAFANMKESVPDEEIPEIMKLIDCGDKEVEEMIDRFNYSYFCFEQRKAPVEGETFKEVLQEAAENFGCGNEDCDNEDCNCKSGE
jgi:hypothetical protein